jgi:hypothetical protein
VFKARILIVLGSAGAWTGPQRLLAQNSGATAAAGQLMELVHMREAIALSMQATYEVAVAADSQYRPLQTVMDRFFADSNTWRELKPALAKFYASKYTPAELAELNKFLSTPVGQKFYREAPGLMKESQTLWQAVIAAHRSDLDRQIVEEKRRARAAGSR